MRKEKNMKMKADNHRPVVVLRIGRLNIFSAVCHRTRDLGIFSVVFFLFFSMGPATKTGHWKTPGCRVTV